MARLRMIWYIPSEIAGEEALGQLLDKSRRGQLYRKGDMEAVESAAVCWNGERLAPEHVSGGGLGDILGGKTAETHQAGDRDKPADVEIGCEDILLITATDRGLDFAKRNHIAVIAYANPQYPKEMRREAEYVVEGFEEFGLEEMDRVYRRFHGLPWEILMTERCLVRELAMPDVKALFELYDDDEIRRFVEPLYEFEEERNYERAYIDNIYRFYGYGMWLVFHRQTGELIGRAGLEQREFPEGSELEMGYLIAREYRRQGYAAEVCTAIMEYARERLGAERINCMIHKENTASIALAEKIGFTFYGEMETGKAVMLRYVAEGMQR